jgi:hypothetical protein
MGNHVYYPRMNIELSSKLSLEPILEVKQSYCLNVLGVQCIQD